MAQQETRPLLIRMPTELHEAVEETARKQDRSKAQVVREALRAYTRKAGVNPG
jgi:predicted DNA-binding protein